MYGGTCQFCESPDTFTVPTAVIQGKGTYQVFCSFCGATGPVANTEMEAVQKWRKVINKANLNDMMINSDMLYEDEDEFQEKFKEISGIEYDDY